MRTDPKTTAAKATAVKATAYAIVPRGRTAEDALSNRFAPLHSTALSAGRNSGDRTKIARITYTIPDGVTLKAFSIDGTCLAEGTHLAAVLTSAAEQDVHGFGFLVGVHIPGVPANAPAFYRAIHETVFGNTDQVKSLSDFIEDVELLGSTTSPAALAA